MNTITELLQLYGGLPALRKAATTGGVAGPDGRSYIRIENHPYSTLCVEWVRSVPGADHLSVAHYYEQNGDLMKDPEIVFAVTADARGQLHYRPDTYEQSNLGIAQGFDRPLNRYELGELVEFTQMWDENLRAQGFITAYQRQILAHQARLAATPPTWKDRYLARRSGPRA